MRTAIEPHGSENRDQIASQGSLLPFESETLKKKKCYKFCSFQSRSYGGEGRLLEQMVFVEEIEGMRDSDGGGRTAVAEACV